MERLGFKKCVVCKAAKDCGLKKEKLDSVIGFMKRNNLHTKNYRQWSDAERKLFKNYLPKTKYEARRAAANCGICSLNSSEYYINKKRDAPRKRKGSIPGYISKNDFEHMEQKAKDKIKNFWGLSKKEQRRRRRIWKKTTGGLAVASTKNFHFDKLSQILFKELSKTDDDKSLINFDFNNL
jgi:hypothetical protein